METSKLVLIKKLVVRIAGLLKNPKMSSSRVPPWRPPAPPEFDDPKVRTVKPDPRYQNMNASKWCFATFVDYQRCMRLLGEKSDCCPQFEKIYRAICPNAWVAKWEEQIREGTFPLDLPPEK